jgi:hypothetical protein
MDEENLRLSPGIGFHLQDGKWKPEPISSQVIKNAEFSGFLTINGFRSTVFETADGEMWAQKSTGTPGTASLNGPVSPEIVAQELRRIASYIDETPKTDRYIVLTDLSSIIKKLK